MKKTLEQLESAQVLNRQQLKNVFGGTAFEPACSNQCGIDDDCPGEQACFSTDFGSGNVCNRCILPPDDSELA